MDNQNIEFIRTYVHPASIPLASQAATVTGSAVNLFDPISHQYAWLIEVGAVTTLTAGDYFTFTVEESKDDIAYAETNAENLNYDKAWADDNEGVLSDQNATANTTYWVGYARDVAGIQYVKPKLTATGSPVAEIAVHLVKFKLNVSRDKGEVILKGNEV